MTGTSTTIDREGEAIVFRKRCGSTAGRARLAREHALLERVGHPGIAQVIAFDDDGDTATLTLRFVGNQSAAALVHPGIDEIIRIIAVTAETLADLHRLSVVHGRIQADHLVLDHHGRPVIVGFGAGVNVDCDDADDADDADDPAPTTAADDVRDLALILTMLLERHRDGGGLASLAPSMYSWRVRRQETIATGLLRSLAHRAVDDDPLRRPTARQFAAAVAAAAHVLPAPTPTPMSTSTSPSASLSASSSPPPTSRSAAPPKRGIAVAVAITVAVVAGFAFLSSRGGPRPMLQPPRPGTPVDTGIEAAPPSWSYRHLDAPDAAAAPASSPPGTTVRAAGTRTSLSSSGFVWHDDHQYAVGEPGDHVAVGDFSCTGRPVAALLRPGSGEVFVFDGWADLTGDRVAEVLTIVPSDSHWVATEPDDDGCPPLRARTPDGTELTVPRTLLLLPSHEGSTP